MFAFEPVRDSGSIRTVAAPYLGKGAAYALQLRRGSLLGRGGIFDDGHAAHRPSAGRHVLE